MSGNEKYYVHRRRQRTVALEGDALPTDHGTVVITNARDARTPQQKFELRSADRDIRRAVEAELGRPLSPRQWKKLKKQARRDYAAAVKAA